MTANEAIQALIVRQKRVGDAQDEAAMRECWSRTHAGLSVTRNGAPPGVATGYDQVIAFTLEAWRSGRHGVAHLHLHFAGPMEINLDGEDRGRARYACLYISTDPEAFKIIGYGEYDDVVVRESGEWRLGRREIRQVLSDEWPKPA